MGKRSGRGSQKGSENDPNPSSQEGSGERSGEASGERSGERSGQGSGEGSETDRRVLRFTLTGDLRTESSSRDAFTRQMWFLLLLDRDLRQDLLDRDLGKNPSRIGGE